MKIEKLNKDNIKEFIRDMKLDYTENLEQMRIIKMGLALALGRKISKSLRIM